MTTEIIDLDVAQERLQEILGSKVLTEIVQEHLPKQRKPRSDKGLPKPKKEPQRGWITSEQAAWLDKLLREVVASEGRLRSAEKDYMEYLDELTIKK